MAELKKEQLSNLESYKKPAMPVPGSIIRNSPYRGFYTNPRASRKETLKERIEEAAGDAKTLRAISREQFRINSSYIEVIEYFKNMYFYRYMVIPSYKGDGKRLSKTDLLKLNRNMVDVVDALSIETLFPKILEKGLVDGVVYLYTYKKNNQPNVMILPEEYCERYRETNYNTETILFNFAYFNQLETRARQYGLHINDEYLSMYPRAMVNQYKKYKLPDGTTDVNYQFQELDIQAASAIPFHSEGIPPKILVSAAKENYDNTIDTERERAESQIDSILSMEIPTDADGIPLFDATEAGQIQALLAAQLQNVIGIKVITPIGNASILKPQDKDSVKNEAINKAYEQVFHEALLNPRIFTSETNYAIEMSYNRDASFVWVLLEKIMNYFNLSLNKVYNFGDYGVYIQLLPITQYNWQKKEESSRKAGEYGIGRLEAILSTGTKQSTIFDKAALEDALDLDEILKPLQSSHTRSANEAVNVTNEPAEEGNEELPEKRNEDEEE